MLLNPSVLEYCCLVSSFQFIASGGYGLDVLQHSDHLLLESQYGQNSHCRLSKY